LVVSCVAPPTERLTGGTLPGRSRGAGVGACQTPTMLGGQTFPRWRALVVGGALLAGTGLATACEPQVDAQPPVASVNFEPRLVVTVGEAGMTAEPGGRDGAEIVHGDHPADWNLPAGSVVELRNDATGPQRVLITRQGVADAPLAEAPVWLDTGDLLPGESVVLGLSAAGDYALETTTTGLADQPDLVLRVAPRPTV
jgi:hypothetical protein